MQKLFKKQRGFTLIELLIVITIIGILTAIGLASYSSTQMKARDAKRKSDLQTIARALELYYNDYHHYPTGSGNGGIIGCMALGAQLCDKDFIADTNQYLLEMPTDPKGNYYYLAQNGGYFLLTRLENLQDKDAVKSSGKDAGYSSLTCSSGGKPLCNYAIASSNNSLSTIGAIVVE